MDVRRPRSRHWTCTPTTSAPPRARATSRRTCALSTWIWCLTRTSPAYGPIDDRQAFLIATDLRPLLLGADPFAIEQLHDRMLRLHRHGRAGLFVTAISAVDNAVWDLRGKAAGEPVYRLLGGPTSDGVPAYASMLGYSVEPERAAAAAAEHKAEGFGAQKWFFAYGPGAGTEGSGGTRDGAGGARGGGGRVPADVRRVRGMGRDVRVGHAPRPRARRAALYGGAGAARAPRRVPPARGEDLDPARDGRARPDAMADQAAAGRRRRRDPPIRTGRAGSPSSGTSARSAPLTTSPSSRTGTRSPSRSTSQRRSRRRWCR